LEFYTFVADNYTAFYSLPSECTRIKNGGRGEGWKNGRMEGWKNGRMEGWKSGRMEEGKGGRAEPAFAIHRFGVWSLEFGVPEF
jgi:hypothetical protein